MLSLSKKRLLLSTLPQFKAERNYVLYDSFRFERDASGFALATRYERDIARFAHDTR